MNKDQPARQRSGFLDEPYMRLIRTLADSEMELTLSTLSRKANLNHTSASRMTRELMELGLVRRRDFGRIHLFRLNPLDRRAQLLRELLSHGFG